MASVAVAGGVAAGSTGSLAVPQKERTGWIASIDVEGSEFALREKTGEGSFYAPIDARITEGGRQIPLSGLRAGSKVKVAFHWEGDHEVADRVFVVTR